VSADVRVRPVREQADYRSDGRSEQLQSDLHDEHESDQRADVLMYRSTGISGRSREKLSSI